MKIIFRKQAKSEGLIKYFTGKPCKHAHIAERVTTNGACTACVKLRKAGDDKKYRVKNLEAIQAYDRNRARRAIDPDKLKAAKKRHYEKHKEQILEKMQVHRDANKTEKRAYFKKYKANNAHKVSAWNAKRRAAKLHRTPVWLTDDDYWMLEQAYELAQMRTKLFGFSWQVDHIIPLQGRFVSGLHVPTNVQVIPGLENARKGNRV